MKLDPRIFCCVLIALALSPALRADQGGAGDRVDYGDLKTQPFIYGSIGAFTSGAGGGVTVGAGGGLDWLAYEGLGLGFDLVVFGSSSYSFAVASVDVSYHFIPGSGRIVPFVVAGIGAGGEGGSSVTIASFGGGLNLWTGRGLALRAEVRARVPAEGGDTHVSAQLGITF